MEEMRGKVKKVLIFGLSSLYAGVEALILNYVNHLDENEYAVDLVVTERKPEYLDDKLLRNVDIRIVPNRVRNYVAYVKSMDKIVKTGGYDIIWANFCTLTDIQVLKSAQKYDVPIRIAHSHNSENMGSFLVMATHLMNKKKIIQYAKSRGVGIWLYLNDVGGRNFPISETLKLYHDWGAVGVKYGFMKGSEQEKNIRTRMITELCARNQLLVDFHDGPVHPYGQMRTWPNAITREYCHAQLDAHRVFVPSTFVTSVFVNMLAGPIDMNNGMFDLRQGPTTRVDENQPVPSTVVSEAARTLVTFSGATILPDIPEYYEKYPELLSFISAQQMPWKESRTLDGKVGEYIVMMRQTDNVYLVGAVTNESARELEIPLSFLPRG